MLRQWVSVAAMFAITVLATVCPAWADATITSPCPEDWVKIGTDFYCSCTTTDGEATWDVDWDWETDFLPDNTGNTATFRATHGGIYTLSAYDNLGGDDVTVYVAELYDLWCSGMEGEPWGEQFYAPKSATGYASVYADVFDYPWPAPGGIVTWSGGTNGADQFERRVSTAGTGNYSVTGTVGTSSDSLTVTVYEISDVAVLGATVGQSVNTYYTPVAAQGQYITVSVSTYPNISNAWGLVDFSGDGEMVDEFTWRISKWESGTQSVRIRAGDYDRTLTFEIVDITGIQVEGATSGSSGDIYYARQATGEDVTFTATLSQDITMSDLPANFLTWSVGGQAAGTNVDEIDVSRGATTSPDAVVSVTCGSVTRQKSLVVFEPQELVVTGAEEWAPDDTYYTPVGSGTVQITLVTTPAIPDPSDFPWDLLWWSDGDTGSNELQRTVDKSMADERWISVDCDGFTDAVTICVVSVDWFEVDGAVESFNTWGQYYAAVENGAYVTLTAYTWPYVDPANILGTLVTWDCSGGSQGENQLEWKIPKSATGAYTCTATCGTSSWTVTVTVLQATSVTVTGATEGLPVGTYYSGIGGQGEQVTLEVSLTPQVDPYDLPWGVADWSGDVEPDWSNPLVAYITKDQSGSYDASVVSGSFSQDITVCVVEVTDIDVAGVMTGNTPGTYYAQTGAGSATVSATFSPAVAMGNLPDDLVVWAVNDAPAGTNTESTDVSLAVGGAKTVQVVCGDSSLSVEIIVTEVTALTVTGATPGNPSGTWYSAKDYSGDVAVTVTLTPSVPDPNDLPWDFISWSGDGDDAGPLERRISRNYGGEYTVSASCGGWSDSATICVIELMWLEVSDASPGMYYMDHFYAPKAAGQTSAVTAWIYPDVAEADLPDGIVEWTGDAQGTGKLQRTFSRSQSGNFSASVTCGPDMQGADFTVFEVTALTVSGAVPGNPAGAFYATIDLQGEYVEVSAGLTPTVDEMDFPWDALVWTGGDWYDSALTRVVPKWVSGSTEVGLTCGDFSETVSVSVVEVTDLQVSGAEVGQTPGTYYVARADGEVVTLVAQINPAIAPENLPAGFLNWSGGSAGATVLDRSVSRATPGATTVSVVCGESSEEAVITVVEATVLTVAGAQPGNPAGTWYSTKDAGYVTLTVTLNPSIPDPNDLPWDFISWSGDGEEVSRLERRIPKDIAGEYNVQVACGTWSDEATVCIIELMWLEVSNASMGMVDMEHYYAPKSAVQTSDVTAWIYPDVAEADLPDGMVVWSGSAQGTGKLQRTFPHAQVGDLSAMVTCGMDSQAALLTVYEVTDLSVTGAIAGLPQDTYYAQLGQMEEYVEVTAAIVPTIDEMDFPWDALAWTGGDWYDSVLTRVVPKWQSGTTDVGLVCGDFSRTVTVHVVEVTDMSVTPGEQGQTPGTYYVTKAAGESVILTAQIEPALSPENLPGGFLSWAGGSAGVTVLERLVSRDVPGTTEVSVTCGESSQGANVCVVEAGTLTVTGAIPGNPADTWYAAIANDGYVSVQLALAGGADPADLPWGFVEWSGGDPGADALESRVSKTTSGQTTVSVSVGGDLVGEVDICIVEVMWLDVMGASEGTIDFDQYYAGKSAAEQVTLTALINPMVDVADLPEGLVVWTGGDVQDRLTRTMSRATPGSFPASVTCGTSGRAITLCVYEVTALTVTGADAGTPAGTYYTPFTTDPEAAPVAVTATVNPAVDTDDFPWGELAWTGGDWSENPLVRTVPKTVSGQTTVGLTSGDFSEEAVIRVVEVTALTVDGASMGATDGVYYAPLLLGGTATVTAEINPAIAPEDLPAFLTIVGGDSLNGLTASIQKDTPRDVTVTVTCGESQMTARVFVIELLSLTVTGAEQGNPLPTSTNYYAGKAEAGDVIVEAQLLPATLDPADVGLDVLMLTGGEPGEHCMQRKVTKTVADVTDVTATCGDDMSVTIKIVEVAWFWASGASEGYPDPQGETKFYAGLGAPGAYAELTALFNPDVTQEELPAGFIVWTGGMAQADPAGDNELGRRVAIDTPGTTTVTVTAGGTDSMSKEVVAVELLGLDVTEAEQGLLTETWYASLGYDDVIIGASTNPAVDPDLIPDDLIMWGDVDWWDGLEAYCSRYYSGERNVSATCGIISWGVDVIIVEVTDLQMAPADQETYPGTGWYSPMLEGEFVMVDALTYPEVDPDDLPVGIVEWTGTEGPGDHKLQEKVNRDTAREVALAATCGISEQATTLKIYDVTVTIRRSGSTEQFAATALIAVGHVQTQAHQCDIRVATTPAVIGAELNVRVKQDTALGYPLPTPPEERGPNAAECDTSGTTGADGTVILTGAYLSSNVAQEGVIELPIPYTGTDPENPEQVFSSTATANHKWDDPEGYEWFVPSFYVPGRPDNCDFRSRLLGGTPIDGHTMGYFTTDLVVYWYEFNLSTGEELDGSEGLAYPFGYQTLPDPPVSLMPFGLDANSMVVHSSVSEPEAGIYRNQQTVYDYYDLVVVDDELVWREAYIDSYSFAIYDRNYVKP